MIMNAEQEQQLLEGSLARLFKEGGPARDETRRQRYAGRALPAVITAYMGWNKTPEDCAACAWRYADAMLATEHLDAAKS